MPTADSQSNDAVQRLPTNGRIALTNRGWLRMAAWLILIAALLNATCFVWRVTSPVVQSDAWYFLDVFVRKAIAGNLGLGDFFVRRAGADHAQPLFKLALLLEWRYFDLDFMIEALIGIAGALGSALLLHRIVFAQTSSIGSSSVHYLAWATICALLYSMNAEAGVWTWSLVSLEQVATLCVIGYMAIAWAAIVKQRYALLALATLVIGICCDDIGMFAAISVGLAATVGHRGDARVRQLPLIRILLAIAVPILLVRIGYTFAPIVGGKTGALTSYIGLLPQRFIESGFWTWIAVPLVLPVYYPQKLMATHLSLEDALLLTTALVLVIAHFAFWRRAFFGTYNTAIFVAVALMLLTYGEIAGIIIGRVAYNGNAYLYQTRYTVRFVGHLIALLLMWSGSQSTQRISPPPIVRRLTIFLPSIGCLLLLALQVPLSFHAWNLRSDEWNYQAALAHGIQTLTIDPANKAGCLPELTVCGRPLDLRRELTRMLFDNRLNVFSPRVQRWHPQLPKLPASAAAVTAPNH